jgi:hypothetical protein
MTYHSRSFDQTSLFNHGITRLFDLFCLNPVGNIRRQLRLNPYRSLSQDSPLIPIEYSTIIHKSGLTLFLNTTVSYRQEINILTSKKPYCEWERRQPLHWRILCVCFDFDDLVYGYEVGRFSSSANFVIFWCTIPTLSSCAVDFWVELRKQRWCSRLQFASLD